MFRAALLATVAVLGMGVGASSASATPAAIVVRIVETPTFLDATAECPAGRGEAVLRSPAGEVVGSVDNCVLMSDFSCSQAGCTLVERAVQTFHLSGGTIQVHATLTYRFKADFSSAAHVIGGSVVGGTGPYASATGALVGGGSIRFDAEGTPRPNLTEVLILR